MTYGIRWRLPDGDILEIPDVDTSRDSVERLLTWLADEPLDADQLRYLIEDHLAREYSIC